MARKVPASCEMYIPYARFDTRLIRPVEYREYHETGPVAKLELMSCLYHDACDAPTLAAKQCCRRGGDMFRICFIDSRVQK